MCRIHSTTVDQVSQVANQILSEQRQFWGHIFSALALVKQDLKESSSTRAALTGSLGDLRQLTLELPSPPDSTPAKISVSKTLQVGQTTSKLHPPNRLRVGGSQHL